MKNLLKIVLVGLILFLFSIKGEAQDFTTSHGYLSFIIEKEKIVEQSVWEYIKTSAHSNRDKKIARKKEDLIETIQKVVQEIAFMPAFEGDASLRDSMVVFFERSVDMLKGDYAEIEILEKDAGNSYQAMRTYLDVKSKANEKYAEANEKISIQVDKFAEKNGINLVEGHSKLSANLKISNIVFTYYEEIYLIYFRGLIEDSFIIDAINNDDTTAIKMHLDSLTIAYAEGQNDLKQIKSYNGDYSLKYVCQKSLSHYKKEATLYIPKILIFYRVEAELDRVKTEYEAIPEKDVTQDDINKYNFTVAKYNTAIKEYNITMEKMNDDMQNNQKQWTDVVDKFMKNHIPK